MLLLDVDGVIADFCRSVDDLLIRDGHRPAKWLSWELDANIPPCCTEYVLERLQSPGYALRIPEIPGAVDAVRRAIRNGIPIAFVTTPMAGSRTWAGDREVWLRDRFGLKPAIIHTDHKDLIRGDLLVDDKIAHVEDFPGPALLVRRSYNVADPIALRCGVDHVADAITIYCNSYPAKGSSGP
jgi:5'(3')-deoxyribonucleotidase